MSIIARIIAYLKINTVAKTVTKLKSFTGRSFQDRKNHGKQKLTANSDWSQQFERSSTEIAIQ